MNRTNIQSTTRTLLTLLTLSLVLIGTGCKSKKHVLDPDSKLKAKSDKEIVSDVLSSALNYKTITTKGSIEIGNGSSSKKVTTVFNIIKDSLLQASVRPILGIEAVRATFTPDSVFIIDRLNKQYVAEEFSGAIKSNNINFNFYNLQALFTNQLFLPGEKSLTDKNHTDFNIGASADNYLLRVVDRNKMNYNFAIDAADKLTSVMVTNTDKDLSVMWQYEDFIKDGSHIYPTSMQAKVVTGKHKINLGISYSKLDIDKTLNIDYALPSKYTKVTFSKFISSYIKK